MLKLVILTDPVVTRCTLHQKHDTACTKHQHRSMFLYITACAQVQRWPAAAMQSLFTQAGKVTVLLTHAAAYEVHKTQTVEGCACSSACNSAHIVRKADTCSCIRKYTNTLKHNVDKYLEHTATMLPDAALTLYTHSICNRASACMPAHHSGI